LYCYTSFGKGEINVSKKTSNKIKVKRSPVFYFIAFFPNCRCSFGLAYSHIVFLLRWKSSSHVPLILFASIHSGILYVIIFQVSGILIRNYSVERANEKELKTLRFYGHNSQGSNGNRSVSNPLRVYTKNSCEQPHNTVLPKGSIFKWNSMGETYKGKIPSLHHGTRNCPVVKYGRECLVKNIATDIPCANQLPEHKSGSYICLPITEEI